MQGRRALFGALGVLLVVLPACGGDDPQPAAPDAAELLPNLVAAGPTDISVQDIDGRRHLRFEIDVRNAGPGVVEVAPLPPDDCDGNGNPDDDRSLEQQIYDDDGDVARRRAAGCSLYHPGHNHWHVDNFARYALRPVDGDEPVVSADKVTFCLHDLRRVGGEGSPTEPHYLDCGSDAVQGISVGWSDDYYAELEGQSLDVTDVAAGDYCLVAEVNEARVIDEADRDDNTVSTLVRLTDAGVDLPADDRCGDE